MRKIAAPDPTPAPDRIWNFEGDTCVPDFDLYIWDWAGYSDPGQTLSAEVTAQIGNTNEPCCSRSCTSRRRGWCSRTRSICRPTTTRRGPAGWACSTEAGGAVGTWIVVAVVAVVVVLLVVWLLRRRRVQAEEG